MRLRTHSDGSVWTRDGRLLWYYPNQQQESPPIEDRTHAPNQNIHEWDAHTGKYSNVSTVVPEVDERCQVNEVCIDGECVEDSSHIDNFFNSDLIMTSRRTSFVVLDASTSWIVFDRDYLRKGDVLQHRNNNCIEILDDGIKVGDGVKYTFVAKPAVHSDALRAGEKWTLIKKAER